MLCSLQGSTITLPEADKAESKAAKKLPVKGVLSSTFSIQGQEEVRWSVKVHINLQGGLSKSHDAKLLNGVLGVLGGLRFSWSLDSLLRRSPKAQWVTGVECRNTLH